MSVDQARRPKSAPPPVSFFWRDMGLQRRIMSFVGLGCVALVLLFGYLTQRTMTTSVELTLNERVQLVQLMAREVDWILANRPDTSGAGPPTAMSAAVNQTLARLSGHGTGVAADPPFYVAWIDDGGELLAGHYPVPDHDEHVQLLSHLIGKKQPVTVEHLSTNSDVFNQNHVLVYVSLNAGPGGLVMEQSTDMAMVVPLTLQRRLMASGVAVIVAGLALAWLTTRQVVRPIEDLTMTAQRIAGGDLETPVPLLGQDETIQLAQAFEEMRWRLQDTLAELTTLNQRLEDRVEERTRKLQQAMGERTRLLKRTIDAQEEERVRIARELHDEVGQFLTGMMLHIRRIESDCCHVNPVVGDRFAEVKDMAHRTMSEVRRMIMSLRPSVLDDMGLGTALSWYAERFLEPAGVRVDVELEDADNLPDHVQVTVFRVVQEAMTNILKHAGATRVLVRIHVDRALHGQVSDDGVGFDMEQVDRESAAVGLVGMRERISLLGGRLNVESRPGSGTTVSFRVPLEGEDILDDPGDSRR